MHRAPIACLHFCVHHDDQRLWSVVVMIGVGAPQDSFALILRDDRQPRGWRQGVGRIIAKLNDAVVDALADPKVRARMADPGQEIFPRDRQTPEALRVHQKAEIEKWWPIVKAANIKGE
jgi:hypothetical protein